MMRLTTSLVLSLTLVLTCLFSLSLYSQKTQIDSLHKVLKFAKQDSFAVYTMLELSHEYYKGKNLDSSLGYAMQAKRLANKLNLTDTKVLQYLNAFYALTGNHSQSLKTQLELLKIYESRKDSLGIASTLSQISDTYDELEYFEEALIHARKAYDLIMQIPDKEYQLHITSSVGYAYIQIHQFDSALVFYQKANQMLNSWKEAPADLRGMVMYGLGRVNYELGNVSIAIPYYHKSIEYGKQYNAGFGLFVLLLSYSGIAEIFEARGLKDSAVAYYEKALESNPEVNRVKLNIYRRLIAMFDGANDHMTVKYFKLEAALRDSLFNARKTKEVQTLKFNELERQEQILADQVEERKVRTQNMQYAGIGVATISFFILFLLLSRTIIVSTKAIKIFGIVALLITFEFINLLLHPFLEKITGHSPFLMLVALVCIAALIVPFHHKAERWMIGSLQEKNKKIRLAAAKKTIAELDEQSTSN